MGSAPSTDRAERRRRDRALGQDEEASTAGPLPLVAIPEDTEASVDVRRWGCKVSPEPKEGEEPAAAALPGSPSFRIYCQDAARVDAIVAASHADDDIYEPASSTVAETALVIRKNDLPHGSGEVGSAELSKSKEPPNRWLKFRGQAIVDAMYGLFVCRGKAASARPPPPHHPPTDVYAAPPRHAAPKAFL